MKLAPGCGTSALKTVLVVPKLLGSKIREPDKFALGKLVLPKNYLRHRLIGGFWPDG
jgi:hypothetical protein